MLFTEEEIEQVTEDAIQFYNTKYGLDFSQSEPNELGQPFFQNATFFLFRLSPEVQKKMLLAGFKLVPTGSTGKKLLH